MTENLEDIDEAIDDAWMARLTRGFLDLTLPKAQWTHRAHFAATLWLLDAAGPAPLERSMPLLIRTYNRSVGGVNDDHNGYHATITLASIGAARHVAAQVAGRPSEALAVLMGDRFGRSDWLLAHWSKARLMSVAARRGWVAPDLVPLPFAAGPESR
jgi:hypothetical protein